MRWLALLLIGSACTQSAPPAPEASPSSPAPSPEAPPTEEKTITTPSGLQYVVLKRGLDEKPVRGQQVTVHYTGRFTDGRVFDSSVLENRAPYVFPAGVGRVIKGWDEAILTMGLGEKRRLTIPPHLAYSDRGFGTLIPPNTTLVFELELVGLLARPAGAASAAPKPSAAPTTPASEAPAP